LGTHELISALGQRRLVSVRVALLKPIVIAAAASALFCTGARAQDIGSSMFAFNGFGTAGVVHSSEDQADFTGSIPQPNGAGYSHAWSADVDSRIGAQLTATFTPQFSAVVQLIAEQNYDNSYRPAVEWANIKYQITQDLSVRVGRIVLPVFLVSDFRKVGYANPWVRPPVEVYGVEPLTNNDGIDVSYRLHFGEVTSTLGSTYGRTYRTDFAAGQSSETKDLWGIFDRTEYGAALFNFSYVSAHTSLQPNIALFDDFRQFGPQGIAIADKYELVNKLGTIIALGASYDPGKWFAMGEWTKINTRSFVGLSTAWYVSGGYRIGKFTPYLTYSAVKVQTTSDPGLNLSALPTFLAGPAAALNAGLNEVLGMRPVQRTLSAGSRWDFAKNFDLKLQFDHTRLGPGSPGTLINEQPGFRPGGTVNLFSATIDFVF
jgi:hypothetical protein